MILAVIHANGECLTQEFEERSEAKKWVRMELNRFLSDYPKGRDNFLTRFYWYQYAETPKDVEE